MTEIVERLRADAEHHKQVAGDCDCRPEDTVNWAHALNCLEAAKDIERLRDLIQYCRMRLKQDAYGEHVDKCLADLSRFDRDPEMQGKLVQSHKRSWTGPGHLEETGYTK